MRRTAELIALGLVAALLSGCSDDSVGPGIGSMEVVTVTSGEELDPDGYLVVVGSGTGRTIGLDGTLSIADLTAGVHEVELAGVAANCTVAGANPRTVRVAAGATASTTFEVVCHAVTGALEVATETRGQDIDPAGYLVVTSTANREIGVNGTVTITGLAAGDQQVELRGMATNCAVVGANPRTLTVVAGATVTTTFEVACEAVRPLTGQIAFWSSSAFGAEVHIMNTDGSGQTRLTDGAEPAVSPDGTRILFVRDGDIHVMNANGSGVVNLTNHPAFDFRPRWSPDGTRIAFTSDRDSGSTYDIFVMEADGSNPTNLTRDPANDNAATWSPDGTRIAFTSNRTGEFEIFVMNADGSDPVNLTNDPTRSDYGPAWSPDGGKIAFASDRDGSGEIFVMNADGSNRVNLTNHPAHDTWPSWSRDGSRIAFTSNRTGSSQVFVMNADGSAPTNLSNRPGAQHYAGFPQAWSP